MGESKPSWWKKEFDSRYNMLQSLIPHDSSNRQPVQDARFGVPNQGETDTAKLNQPTYNAIRQQQYKGNSLSQVNDFGQQRDISGNTSQQVVFGGGVSRTNNSLQNNNFVNVGGNYSYGVSNNAVVQGANGSNLGSNRAHNGINNSLNGRLCPPSTNINAVSGPTGDGFVTVNRNSVSNVHNVVQTPLVYPQINGTNTGYAVNTNAPATGMPGSVTPAKPNVGNTGGVASVLKDMFAVSDSTKKYLNTLRDPDGQLPQKLRNIPPHLIDSICNEIMDTDPNVRWDDIVGLDHAKKCVNEMAVMPLVRPDIFEGYRSPGHGLLLFGPPGTGKTMIGKAIAGEAKATFFYISASSLTGKFFGDSEKLVRALFGVASCRQPAVIFVDEIDSLLSKRRGGENDTLRKMKTQFLIEMEGFDGGNDQVLLIGATNRPQELDEAARRRLTKRLYIPLPSSEARSCIIRNLLEKDRIFKLSEEDMDNLCKLTGGYSGSDMRNLVKEAAMGPVREALKQETDLATLKKEDMRPVTLQDFVDALKEVKRSVSLTELGTYEDWNSQFGSISTSETSDQPRSGWADMLRGPDGELPKKIRNIPTHLLENICNEIMDHDPNIRLDDIAGLHHAKRCINEMAILPLLRPDLFKGCRSPMKGLLLFGPPGTGKTMIGKAIAGEAKATFFYISASSLTSKWLGESEKLVRALFGVASCRQPAVIFVDEIDSMLSQRKTDGEHECYRRMKTQFFIEMEGFDSGNDQVLLIGATNRPQELEEAARRRLAKRLYIPLPSSEARAWIVRNLLEKDGLFTLSTEDVDSICELTEGYSGSDMKNLVKDASMGPLREALRQSEEIAELKKEDMRSVSLQDFKNALQEVRPSVSIDLLGSYEVWNNQFGSLSTSKAAEQIVERNMKKRKTSEPGAYDLSSFDQISNDLDDDDVYEIRGLLDENAGKRSRETKSTEQKSVQVDDTDDIYNEDQMEVFKGIFGGTQGDENQTSL